MAADVRGLKTDRVIRESTKVVVFGVAAVAAVVSYRHAYTLVTSYGESGVTAVMIPLTIDGLVYASSMVLLDAARNRQANPPLAWFLLCLGIAATLAANVAHGLEHGPVGALIAAWPAVALVGCYEMLMLLVRTNARTAAVVGEPDEETLAVAYYRTKLAEGGYVSERALASEFRRSRRWAKSVIARATTAGD